MPEKIGTVRRASFDGYATTDFPKCYKTFELFCADVIADWIAKYAPGKKYEIKIATPSVVDIILVEEGTPQSMMDSMPGCLRRFQRQISKALYPVPPLNLIQ